MAGDILSDLLQSKADEKNGKKKKKPKALIIALLKRKMNKSEKS